MASRRLLEQGVHLRRQRQRHTHGRERGVARVGRPVPDRAGGDHSLDLAGTLALGVLDPLRLRLRRRDAAQLSHDGVDQVPACEALVQTRKFLERAGHPEPVLQAAPAEAEVPLGVLAEGGVAEEALDLELVGAQKPAHRGVLVLGALPREPPQRGVDLDGGEGGVVRIEGLVGHAAW